MKARPGGDPAHTVARLEGPIKNGRLRPVGLYWPGYRCFFSWIGGNIFVAAGLSAPSVAAKPPRGPQERGDRARVLVYGRRATNQEALHGDHPELSAHLAGPEGGLWARNRLAPANPALPEKSIPMSRYFESLVDPYASYAEDDTPPDRLLPFLRNTSPGARSWSEPWARSSPWRWSRSG